MKTKTKPLLALAIFTVAAVGATCESYEDLNVNAAEHQAQQQQAKMEAARK